MIAGFNPRCASFIPETKIQGQHAGHAPIVLYKASEKPVALTPPSRTRPPAHILRKPKGPIGSRVTSSAVPRIVAAGSESEDLHTQFAAVAAVKHIDVVTIQLKPGLNHVPSVSPDQHIVKSGHRG